MGMLHFFAGCSRPRNRCFRSHQAVAAAGQSQLIRMYEADPVDRAHETVGEHETLMLSLDWT